MPAPYVPSMGDDDVARIRRWHEQAYRDIAASLPARVEVRGAVIDVPEGVFPPAPDPLFRDAVAAEVRPGERVLDMGTGSGVNAILAARVAREVLAVDVNPAAVEAARANAARNGVADRCRVVAGDLFDGVDGRFDLVVFDPPFRWFPARDALEAAITDDGYRTLGRFVAEVRDHLVDGGRALVHFGTSADLAHLHRLVDEAGLRREVVARSRATRDGVTVTYEVLRLR